MAGLENCHPIFNLGIVSDILEKTPARTFNSNICQASNFKLLYDDYYNEVVIITQFHSTETTILKIHNNTLRFAYILQH